MRYPDPSIEFASKTIVAAVRRTATGATSPVLVALDGPSGAGKSTIAELLAHSLDAVVVPSDDFFAADITDSEWEQRSPAQRASDCIDWRRLRSEAVDPLLANEPARWRAFDFEAGPRTDGTFALRDEWTQRDPSPVIVLDGAYSTRPELADLVDLAVLVDADAEHRRQRLARREDPVFLARWYTRWGAAESYYFTHVRPPSSFDLVVSTSPVGERHN
jgi:uridine kinase